MDWSNNGKRFLANSVCFMVFNRAHHFGFWGWGKKNLKWSSSWTLQLGTLKMWLFTASCLFRQTPLHPPYFLLSPSVTWSSLAGVCCLCSLPVFLDSFSFLYSWISLTFFLFIICLPYCLLDSAIIKIGFVLWPSRPVSRIRALLNWT